MHQHVTLKVRLGRQQYTEEPTSVTAVYSCMTGFRWYSKDHTEEHVGKLDSGVMMHQHVTLKVRSSWYHL